MGMPILEWGLASWDFTAWGTHLKHTLSPTYALMGLVTGSPGIAASQAAVVETDMRSLGRDLRPRN